MRWQYAAFLAALMSWTLTGQTLVDLRTQSKSVDFTSASTTKPFKSGTTLPATCGVGEVFFKTNAAAGSNLYACTATNSWTLESGATTLSGDVTGSPSATVVSQIQGRAVSATAPANGQSLAWSSATSNWTPQTITGAQGPAGPQGPTGSQGPAGANGAISRIQNAGSNLPVEATLNFTGGGCTDDPANGRTSCTGSGGGSGVTIATNGTTQGTQPTLNFIAGNGIVQTCVNNAGANRVDCTPSLNSAVALTTAVAQSGAPIYCRSSNGSTAYACSLSAARALTAYSTGMVLLLSVDATCSASCSLNIDNLGPVNIKKIDGSTDPGGTLVANQPQWVAYNGTVFLLMR
jgi:hypothetical protein